MLAFDNLIVRPSENLRSAIQRMTRNRLGVVFVCDDDGHLVGVLSDGDVRRGLLDDALMITPVNSVMNTDPISAATSAEASELVRRLGLVAVPVLDVAGVIHEAAIQYEDSVKILAGGAGNSHPQGDEAVGTIAIIPARGGSKRIPRKNLAKVAGTTLLERAIRAGRDAKSVAHVLVSTDDPEIAAVARSAGAEVPWLRPVELSTDSTSTLEVVVHALERSIESLLTPPDIAVLLEPTAPLRSGEMIDRAVSMLAESDADCVAAVSELPHVFHPEEVVVCRDDCLQPYLKERTMSSRRLRNEQNAAYVLNGLVYAFRVNSVLSGGGIFGRKTLPLVTPWQDFLDIDTPDDLELAAFKVERCLARS